jgi:hypothetical protein
MRCLHAVPPAVTLPLCLPLLAAACLSPLTACHSLPPDLDALPPVACRLPPVACRLYALHYVRGLTACNRQFEALQALKIN